METATNSTPRVATDLTEHSDRPELLEDPRSKRIIAKTIYRELRSSGVSERDVMGIATELLGLVAEEIRGEDAATS